MSATSTNQADLFDYVLEREEKVKHLSLYRERRFTKLGYSCSSILDALPYIRMVLDETHLSNQHVEIVRMLLDSELLLSQLNCLSLFTYKVSLPLLNLVEVGTQDDLCKILPKLFEDLSVGKLGTLEAYTVQYRHIDIEEPTSELEITLLKDMCVHASKTIKLQCGREYGFGQYNDIRATHIHKLTVEERKDLESNNVMCERELGVFDHRAIVSKCRNNKFKAKSLRNDMVLHSVSLDGASKISTAIAKLLNKREDEWNEEQKTLLRLKVEEKIKKAMNASNYTTKLLINCKSWRGPCVSSEELMSVLKDHSELQEKIVMTELAYYRDTHKSDVTANPELFKLNKITHEERLMNLCALLDGCPVSTRIPLPTNDDALKAITCIP